MQQQKKLAQSVGLGSGRHVNIILPIRLELTKSKYVYCMQTIQTQFIPFGMKRNERYSQFTFRYSSPIIHFKLLIALIVQLHYEFSFGLAWAKHQENEKENEKITLPLKIQKIARG